MRKYRSYCTFELDIFRGSHGTASCDYADLPCHRFGQVCKGIIAICPFNVRLSLKLVRHHGWIHPRPNSNYFKVTALLRSGAALLAPETLEEPCRVVK